MANFHIRQDIVKEVAVQIDVAKGVMTECKSQDFIDGVNWLLNEFKKDFVITQDELDKIDIDKTLEEFVFGEIQEKYRKLKERAKDYEEIL